MYCVDIVGVVVKLDLFKISVHYRCCCVLLTWNIFTVLLSINKQPYGLSYSYSDFPLIMFLLDFVNELH